MSDLETIRAVERILAAAQLHYRPELAWNDGECSFAFTSNKFYINLMVDGPNRITWYAVKDGREHWREGITFDGEALPASLMDLLTDELKYAPAVFPHLARPA